MAAFVDELEKIAQQARGPQDAAKTVGAPRSKLPGQQAPKAPTVPGKLSPKLIMPGSKYGKQKQTYSKPNEETPPTTNPSQGAMARHVPPPNVVFGVR